MFQLLLYLRLGLIAMNDQISLETTRVATLT